MSRRPKKTNRPKRYPDERRAEWVAYALQTTIDAAALKFGVNHQTVRNHLKDAGHSPRRLGAPTRQETNARKLSAA